VTTCPKCGDSFHNDAYMRQHHTKIHGERLPNSECSECGKEFFVKGGRKYCEEHRDFSGAKNPNYASKKEKTNCEICHSTFEYYPSNKPGKYCSKCVESGEHYKKLDGPEAEKVTVTCIWCGKEEVVEKHETQAEGWVCERNCLDEYNSNRMSGENNPRYKDGKSKGKKYASSWRKVREEIESRDEGECQICAKDSNRLHGHHIIPVDRFENEENSHYKENAVLLCPSCHRNVEYGNIELPEKVIEEKGLEEPPEYNFQKS